MVPKSMKHGTQVFQNGKTDNFLNKTSIGIELSNKGHRLWYEQYSKNKFIL